MGYQASCAQMTCDFFIREVMRLSFSRGELTLAEIEFYFWTVIQTTGST